MTSLRMQSWLWCALGVLGGALISADAAPAGVQYQGRLLDAYGNPVNGNVNVSVAVYTNEVSGGSVYAESLGTVAVSDGLYAFTFGTAAGFDAALAQSQCWLQLTVNGAALAPRQRLLSVPYARRAALTEAVDSNTVFAAGAVPGNALAAGAVASAQLGTGAVQDIHVAADANLSGTKVAAATDIQRGTVQLANNGETTAGKVVQANDTRLLGGAASGWTDSGSTVQLTTVGDTVRIGDSLGGGKLQVQTVGSYAVNAQALTHYAVYGTAANLGIFGNAANSYGVYGYAGYNNGVVGNAAETYGVYGAANLYGVYGWGRINNGVVGSSYNYGVYGRAANNYGVYAYADGNYGVYGNARISNGVYGNAPSYGVYGNAFWNGVHGMASENFGVSGNSAKYNGVFGWANYQYAVRGEAGHNYGVYGFAPQNYGVYGTSTWYGVYGAADVDGVHGHAAVNGVSGYASEQNGVVGFAPSYAIGAKTTHHNAVHANAGGHYGVYSLAAGDYGVYGRAGGSYGGWFSGAATGLYAEARSPGGVAVAAQGLILQNGTNVSVEGHTHPVEPPSGPAGGDLAGTYPNPSIAPGAIVDTDVNASAAITGSKVVAASTAGRGTVELATDGESAANLAVQANDARLSNARTPTGVAGGDLAGSTYPNPQLAAGVIVDADVSAAAAIAGGKVTMATTLARGTVWLADDGDSGVNRVVQANDGRLANARTPTGTAGGDLAGAYPSPTLRSGLLGWTDDGGIVRLTTAEDQVRVGVISGGTGKFYVDTLYNANAIVGVANTHAVYGDANSYYGVYGQANYCAVYGTSVYDQAVCGVATRNYALNGVAGHNYGVYGNAAVHFGVYGVAGQNNGVYGLADAYGVYGNAVTNRGVYGQAGVNYGVYGYAVQSYGVYGNASQYGVSGYATTDYGVHAYAGANNAAYANAANYGVYGYARNSYGVYGGAKDNAAVGDASLNYGVFGKANFYGVYGTSVYDKAVCAVASRHYAFHGTAGENYAVYANARLNYGVYGQAGVNYGVYGQAGNFGVYGNSGNDYGVYGHAVASYGVYGHAGYDNGVVGNAQVFGVSGHATDRYGVHGYAVNDFGGYFGSGVGNAIYCAGTLVMEAGHGGIHWSNGSYKAFTLDHPLDPAGAVLRHFSAEGPEALVVYRGRGVLGANGEAQVALPAYFDALSRDAQVQLTPVGQAVPLALKEEFTGNTFGVLGPAGVAFHWQVTAERDDPKARLEREQRPVEQRKGTPGAPAAGTFVSPECFPSSAGVRAQP